MNLMGLIGFLIIGCIAGWIAGNLMKGRGFGILGNMVVGVIGALVGGYTITLGGTGYRDDVDGQGEYWLQPTMDGEPIDAQIVSISPTQFVFVAPAHPPGRVTFGVLDRETGVLTELPADTFEYR